MKERYSAHAIVEAALMAALIVVFSLMASYVPIIGPLFIFIAPIPIVVLNIKYNYKVGIGAVLVSAVIIGIFSGVFNAIMPLILYAPCGLILGVCIRKNKKTSYTAVILTITNIISIIVYSTVYLYLLMNMTFMKWADETIKLMQDSLSIYEKMGINLNSNPAYVQMMNIDAKMLLMAVPAALIVGAVISSIITYNIARKVINRLNMNINVQPMIKFADWYIGIKAGAALILIVCIAMFLVQKKVIYSEYIMGASLSLFSLIMIVSGLTIVDYYLVNKLKMGRVMAGILCVLIVSPLSVLLLSLGIVDLIFDIRGKDENSIGSALRRRINSKQ